MTERQPPGRFVYLAAAYPLDPKIIRAGADAELVWVRALAISRHLGTDGHIATEQLELVTRGLPRARARPAPPALIREGLWEPCDDGFRVPWDKWSRWQKTQADYSAQREAERERKARYRAGRRADTPKEQA